MRHLVSRSVDEWDALNLATAFFLPQVTIVGHEFCITVPSPSHDLDFRTAVLGALTDEEMPKAVKPCMYETNITERRSELI